LVKEALAAPKLVPAGWISGYRVAMAVRRQNSNKQHAARSARRGFRPDRPSVNSLFVVASRDSPPPVRRPYNERAGPWHEWQDVQYSETRR